MDELWMSLSLRRARVRGRDRGAREACGASAEAFSRCCDEWSTYALTSPALAPVSAMVQQRTAVTLTEKELAAYDAPYPSYVYMAAPRTFPSMMGNMVEPGFGNTAAYRVLERYRWDLEPIKHKANRSRKAPVS